MRGAGFLIVAISLAATGCKGSRAHYEIPICDAVDVNCRCALPGWVKCGTYCVDAQVDRANCGGCGVSCGGEVCSQGTCVAACPGLTCEGQCTYANDPKNCGGCGKVCAFSCTNGSCASDPEDGGSSSVDAAQQPRCSSSKETVCGSLCYDLQTDELNCGACGFECFRSQTPSTGPWVCDKGECCNGAICDGACTDTNNDTDHCGSCGNRCNFDESCHSGFCY